MKYNTQEFEFITKYSKKTDWKYVFKGIVIVVAIVLAIILI